MTGLYEHKVIKYPDDCNDLILKNPHCDFLEVCISNYLGCSIQSFSRIPTIYIYNIYKSLLYF